MSNTTYKFAAMTKFISIITMSALLIWGCGHSAVEQSSNQQIAALMEAGEFTRATAAIKEKIAKVRERETRKRLKISK